MFPFSNSFRKVGLLTAFSMVLVAAAYGSEILFPGRFFRFHDVMIAVGICWLSDGLSIIGVDAARRRSGMDIAGVWIGTLPRLGGPMLAIVVITLTGDPKADQGLLACLVFVYLVSLPLATWLTLPEVNRKIETSAETDSADEDP